MVDIHSIPNIGKNPLQYVFEDLKTLDNDNNLWLEFGVYKGITINFFSKFTNNKVYGFDSFEGLPEDWRPNFPRKRFHMHGKLPEVNKNVELVIGLFQNTLKPFLKKINGKKKSFLHIDCDIYSSTNYILDNIYEHLDKKCIIVFDDFVNYRGYEEGELKAFIEFVKKNNVKYKWIGMNGTILDEIPERENSYYQKVALQLDM